MNAGFSGYLGRAGGTGGETEPPGPAKKAGSFTSGRNRLAQATKEAAYVSLSKFLEDGPAHLIDRLDRLGFHADDVERTRLPDRVAHIPRFEREYNLLPNPPESCLRR